MHIFVYLFGVKQRFFNMYYTTTSKKYSNRYEVKFLIITKQQNVFEKISSDLATLRQLSPREAAFRQI